VPELPEVEVVRRGLEAHVVGRRIGTVDVLTARSIRRHLAGATDFADRLRGRAVISARRRGKYLWLTLDAASPGDDALLAHLGMSGQLLVQPASAPLQTHTRVRLRLDTDVELRFVDQRTFGGLAVFALLESSADGSLVPQPVAHIGVDPLEATFDPAAFTARLRRRRTGVKRALLDQTLASGIGNIYADEALWRSRLHYARPTETLRRAEVTRLVADVQTVMREALQQGGTSFDSLYVNVNGQSGYFDRSLAVYGQQGRPCPRCGTPVRRDAFMNRSSFTCPRCQPRPRRAHW
jgi:formamidopyrimidine-DNA glycosylase